MCRMDTTNTPDYGDISEDQSPEDIAAQVEAADLAVQQAQADERDEQIVASRMAALDEREGPRVGDFVRFADGIERRISYHWKDDTGWDGGCQTSDTGSYHLGNYGVSMSGSLFSSVPTDSLVLTDERKAGDVWIFHHDHARADNGVHFQPEFRVYTCELQAPR